ncbi:MAG: MerR family transcriptional regulator [Sulfurimonas sp.]|uniref:MerR family transcriptional regulator n=1 Tax=Sulfurimonas sp. TaxID=2022749 RepID=UPI0028CEF2FD|nr:MerR family transcriptional regulator [Sulfurimonas sp.]MDT8338754.1 MerR family transcriptional regulator [Sulfurimonas sp.]
MEYKISELVAKTNVPKSTVLYYIREGLLPEAKKLKSNVHRYGNEHIELLEYIKYMKQEVGSSNEQIKEILQNKNQSFSSSSSMIAPLMQTLGSIPKDAKHYTKEGFIELFSVDAEFLEELLRDGLLLPLAEDDFTQKELSIVRLIEKFKSVGVDYEIIKEYALHAKALAELELKMQKKLCDKRDDDNFSTLWKIMFDTLFGAKAYLFNRSTYQMMHKALKEEISKK